jgi:hypothetical protein
MNNGDPSELRQQIEKALNGLAGVTTAHNATWHLERGSWNVDQNVGTIVFSMPDGMKAEAPVQIIGTYSTSDSTWLWGWDHPSVLPRLAENAKRMRDYGHEKGFDRLTTRKLHCTEEECWELTALAFLVCNANGAYRGPAGTVRVFMTFGEIKLSMTQ